MLNFHFQLWVQVRLLTNLGGDGTVHGINVLNDTGSNMLTIFYEDLERLGNSRFYRGWQGEMDIGAAGGQMENLYTLLVEVQFVQPITMIPWGPWFSERAVLRRLVEGADRLSGAGMREHLCFGTRAGNEHLAVSTTKGGLYQII